MDLLNTQVRSNGEDVDLWRTGEDVAAWMARLGLDGADSGVGTPETLLAQAKALRALARGLVASRKAGEPVQLDALNQHLHAYRSTPHLARDVDGHFVLQRRAANDDAEARLGPVAESVASLLVEGDFALVKQCEHPDCILWFYDRTKSHKRRWCSMAQCGNRHKAAQFRKRNSDAP
ncbi:ABATE domain-containing protein [Pseudoxanthomonas sp. GM95]|uniref:CGNR zinc finger domain-containing protein n=1 Tax=Pseudoxanthomonas sp. GM95 TaxID=1881043 RepID=UPI001C315374|nr:ABATE domain-containing protein [Pseudoxanthomonas sp. GM95]